MDSFLSNLEMIMFREYFEHIGAGTTYLRVSAHTGDRESATCHCNEHIKYIGWWYCICCDVVAAIVGVPNRRHLRTARRVHGRR